LGLLMLFDATAGAVAGDEHLLLLREWRRLSA
jgi:hypothetical protein